ncbi:nucleic acid-binding protein [Rhizopus microsporus var. microsporus]|uniref:CST complex subunit STN1 n=1 Tax=Rhizopus microsporus var. microsporus TaxID=86635 RepID=A0A1X0RE53_RHIZD|nr:nucleic acid-binding protein [Rhizopus microsporus var. microsporus]
MSNVMIDSNLLYHSYVKIFIKDIYNLTHTKRGLFQYYNRLIDSVEVCGIVAAIDKNKRVATFYVDDSTGIIECGIWHEKIVETPQLGSLVRARGKINEYNGKTQIFCSDIFIMQDPNYELLHFAQAIHYRSECKPLEIETPESRLAETEDGSDAMTSTTNMSAGANVKAALVAYLTESSIQEFFPWETRKVPMIVDLIRNQNGMNLSFNQITKYIIKACNELADKGILQMTDKGRFKLINKNI